MALSCDPQQGTGSIPQRWGLASAHRWERLNPPQLHFVPRTGAPHLLLGMGDLRPHLLSSPSSLSSLLSPNMSMSLKDPLFDALQWAVKGTAAGLITDLEQQI